MAALLSVWLETRQACDPARIDRRQREPGSRPIQRRSENDPNPVRDRPEINAPVVEEKSRSDLEDFSAVASSASLSARANRREVNGIFPRELTEVISDYLYFEPERSAEVLDESDDSKKD